ncbi:putative S-adenosyl-L-methionine-dependent methyltransferase [Mycobacterium kiyosense]|uniref:S-adenosyl-L-methionine-dependent methyltransferase n=2 Tax=Mycobacteriaceae TaxID=1762 RepID=A0A9P3Q2C5_9MYCO|nr:putative S-adenosyl-L-methionine-dependent methyltransferase [Mycobacterium kiyosense]BDE14321.1 putative S-adenosyl-L-methionine-dependent methyltransferase [Mycobacterium sp. 20KCMC460]GLB81463.1 putative S-adenosyl-L-methionine-dependent methyltransferase [Mycobacterium kiyosense]GLB90060.1 putative S-adenosyl-L-methionine-dependent methyltransferase [Mycobacterium kiyosense]GLB93656.1 putative S-adenosyl-L-methionine-dependent methyltransferase [Mycobacterium kiyosense]
MVAASRALASSEPDPLLDDPFADPLVRAVGHPFFVRMLDGEIPLEDSEMPFTYQQRREQITVRTRFFDDFFRAATDAGIRQAVILAAGLDARAYRLNWPAGTVVFEVDQPDVINFKSVTLAQIGAEPTAERRPVGVDLRDDWPEALRDNMFDASEPTAWIAEGLLPYLPPEAQDRLLDHITALSAPGSRMATENITDMSVFTDERARAMRSGWRKHGLDIDVAELVWLGPRRPAGEHLEASGWTVTRYPTEQVYDRYGFAMPDNEILAAFRNAVGYLSAELG